MSNDNPETRLTKTTPETDVIAIIPSFSDIRAIIKKSSMVIAIRVAMGSMIFLEAALASRLDQSTAYALFRTSITGVLGTCVIAYSTITRSISQFDEESKQVKVMLSGIALSLLLWIPINIFLLAFVQFNRFFQRDQMSVKQATYMCIANSLVPLLGLTSLSMNQFMFSVDQTKAYFLGSISQPILGMLISAALVFTLGSALGAWTMGIGSTVSLFLVNAVQAYHVVKNQKVRILEYNLCQLVREGAPALAKLGASQAVLALTDFLTVTIRVYALHALGKNKLYVFTPAMHLTLFPLMWILGVDLALKKELGKAKETIDKAVNAGNSSEKSRLVNDFFKIAMAGLVGVFGLATVYCGIILSLAIHDHTLLPRQLMDSDLELNLKDEIYRHAHQAILWTLPYIVLDGLRQTLASIAQQFGVKDRWLPAKRSLFLLIGVGLSIGLTAVFEEDSSSIVGMSILQATIMLVLTGVMGFDTRKLYREQMGLPQHSRRYLLFRPSLVKAWQMMTRQSGKATHSSHVY